MNIGWFLKTIGIGAIPMIIRILACLLFKGDTQVSMWNPIDFIFFGLTTCLSSILQLSSLKGSAEKWKQLNAYLIWIILVIILLTFELGVVYLNEMNSNALLDIHVAIGMAIALIVLALLFSGIFVYKFNDN